MKKENKSFSAKAGTGSTYIKCDRTNLALDKNAYVESIDLKKALELIKNAQEEWQQNLIRYIPSYQTKQTLKMKVLNLGRNCINDEYEEELHKTISRPNNPATFQRLRYCGGMTQRDLTYYSYNTEVYNQNKPLGHMELTSFHCVAWSK